MNKKKFASVGIFAVAIVIGGGVAYYCYPSAINNALGINTAGVDTISDSDLLATDDGTSTSLAAIDPNVGSDGAALVAASSSPSSAKKSAQKKVSVAGPGISQGSSAATASAQADASQDAAADDLSDGATATAASSSTSMAAAPCSFPDGVHSTIHEVIFNEIAWMGTPSSSAAEWMEIKNSSADEVNLSGWELSNASGKIKITFSMGNTLAPGGLLLLTRGSSTPAAAIAAKIYSGDLVNTGDTLALMDPQCDVSDYLDASGGWPAGNNTTKQTLERDANGIGWHTSAKPGGTPGAENSAGPAVTTTASIAPAQMTASVSTPQSQSIAPIENIPEDTSTQSDSEVTTSPSVTTSNTQSTATTTASTDSGSNNDNGDSASVDDNVSATTTIIAASASGHVLIAAVQIVGAAVNNDLVKLFNPTAAAIDMSGWKLHKKSSTGTDYSLKVFPAGSVIGARQSFVWANSDDGFSETVSANISSTETLAADNSVALMDAAGNIVDAVAWGTGTNQYGEGPPYPTSSGANQLLSRRSSDGVMADTDDNSSDFTIQ
jgi:hypothetical protein